MKLLMNTFMVIISISIFYNQVLADPHNEVFFDDFETDKGWVVNSDNNDNATTGMWERANPQSTWYYYKYYQRGTTVSGYYDLVTGHLAGSSVGSYDIDNGVTTIRSPKIGLPTNKDIYLSFSYYLAYLYNSSSSDYIRIKIIGQTTETVFEETGYSCNKEAEWKNKEISLNSFQGDSIYIQIEAADNGRASLVEAAVDDISIYTVDVEYDQVYTTPYYPCYYPNNVYDTKTIGRNPSWTGDGYYIHILGISEENYDFLYLKQNGQDIHERIHGNLKGRGIVIEVSNNDPVDIIFTSDYCITKKGFHVEALESYPQLSIEAKTVVEYNCSNFLRLRAYIKNTGEVPVKNIMFKYFLDESDHDAPLNIGIEWTNFPCVSTDVEDGFFDVLEAVFNMGDYILAAGAEREILFCFYLDYYLPFDETNDYSYQGIDPDNPNNKVALYVDSLLIGGTEPYYADEDNDGYSFVVEIELGTDPADPFDIPEAAVPNEGNWKMSDEINIIDYDFSNIQGYTGGQKVGVNIAGLAVNSELAPIISHAEAGDHGGSFPQLPANFGFIGNVVKVHVEGDDTISIPFGLPFPDDTPEWISKRFFKLYHYIDEQWEEIPISYVNETSVYFNTNFLGCFTLAATTDNVIFVDQSMLTSGDGSTWEQAKKTLVEALDVTPAPEEIWVAEGTYYPSLDPFNETDRTKTFQIAHRRLLGGFPQGGSQEEKRDYKAFLTILDGDIGIKGDESDNVYHVVKMVNHNEGFFDGFIVTNGFANGSSSDNNKGGGLYINTSSQALYIQNCTFKKNKAEQGGAIYNENTNYVSVDRCVIEENLAFGYGYGGGIFSTNSETVFMYHCWFKNNEADNAGGGICNFPASSAISNCVFYSNKAKRGAALLVTSISPLTRVYNSTFFNNHAPDQASCIVFGCCSDIFELFNSIFWGNTGNVYHIWSNHGVLNVDYNDIAGGDSRIKAVDDAVLYYGSHNIVVDPKFVDAANGNLDLHYNSPCIDAANGDKDLGRDYDINEVIRYDDPSVPNTGTGDPDYVDIGAHEVTPVRFEDVTARVGLNNEDGFRISVADVNNDGYPDLLMHKQANEGTGDVLNKAHFYLNVENTDPNIDCSRKFIDYTEESHIWDNWQGTDEGRHTSCAIFADVDNDGDVDMYTGRYYHRNAQLIHEYNYMELRQEFKSYFLSLFVTL